VRAPARNARLSRAKIAEESINQLVRLIVARQVADSP